MRKIEEEMNHAVDNGLDWRKDNTEVVTVKGFNVQLHGYVQLSGVYLHGNHIANVTVGPFGHKVTPNCDILREWPTRTTMSRLRALGVDVCTRKGVVHLDGKPL